MAVTFTNNFKNILDKLESIIEAEFKGALPIYFDTKHQDIGTKSLRIYPTSQELQDKRTNSFMNLYNINEQFNNFVRTSF